MKISPIATAAVIIALVAIGIASFGGGMMFPIAVATGMAAFLVTVATFALYKESSPEVKQIPVENFSIWADVGEPAAELDKLSSGDIVPAMKIASTDISSLASNSELLSSRLSMLVNKHGFEGITQEGLATQTRDVAERLRDVVKKLGSGDVTSAEKIQKILSSVENCASSIDRVANKLYDFERGKPGLVRIYVEPLRRASEKLSRDLRLAHSNINNYVMNYTRSATVSTPPLAPPTPPAPPPVPPTQTPQEAMMPQTPPSQVDIIPLTSSPPTPVAPLAQQIKTTQNSSTSSNS